MLYKHQQDAVEMAKRRTFMALFHEQGLGKTRTTLEIFTNYRRRVPSLKLLIFCPISVIKDAWESNVNEFFPGKYKFCNMRKYKGDLGDYDILAVNYEVTRARKFNDIIKFTKENDVMVVLDESSKIKNAKSLTFKSLTRIRGNCIARFVLSGTPAPNGQWEYWPQMDFVSPGILPTKETEFRNRFFYLERIRVTKSGVTFDKADVGYRPGVMMQMGYKLKIIPEKIATMNAAMSPWVHRADKKTCLDLPEKIYQTRSIPFNDEQKIAYNDMKKHLITIINDKAITARTALEKIMKLREITSGFIYNTANEPVWISDAKIKELLSVLEEIGDQQVIIFCVFTAEIRKIVDELQGRCSTLYGDTEDKDEEIRRFKEGITQYLVANTSSAQYGLTFNKVSNVVYFSIDYSFEKEDQSQDRIHRIGQEKTCVYNYLLMDGSIDKDIYKALKNKENISEEFLSMFLEGK